MGWLMRVAVIGAGAMGSLFGGLMALAGDEVWLVGHRRNPHIDAMVDRGLDMTHADGRRHARPGVTVDPAGLGQADLVIFLTKAFSTADAARHARPLFGPGTVAVTLQNGVGNAEAIREILGRQPILAGVTNIGANIISPGAIRLTDAAQRGAGGTWIGPFEDTAGTADLARAAACLRRAGILTHEEPDIALTIWRKMGLVCGMAAISSVARLRVGHVFDTAEGVTLLKEIIGEVAAVATAKGVALDPQAAIDYAFGTYGLSRQHITSMAADVLAGLPTEIWAFNEAVVREAGKLGLDSPVNRTMARLLRILEANYDNILPMSRGGPAA
jgi:2-dehydropantoate 2-reductase